VNSFGPHGLNFKKSAELTLTAALLPTLSKENAWKPTNEPLQIPSGAVQEQQGRRQGGRHDRSLLQLHDRVLKLSGMP
jgi:hypothetical protein